MKALFRDLTQEKICGIMDIGRKKFGIIERKKTDCLCKCQICFRLFLYLCSIMSAIRGTVLIKLPRNSDIFSNLFQQIFNCIFLLTVNTAQKISNKYEGDKSPC